MGSSFLKKLESFRASLDFLTSADFGRAHSDAFNRSGVLIEFARTFELAWKAIQACMNEKGMSDFTRGSARSVLNKANEEGIALDLDLWTKMLKDRNEMMHLYNEALAAPVLGAIETQYLPAFQSLNAELEAYRQEL